MVRTRRPGPPRERILAAAAAAFAAHGYAGARVDEIARAAGVNKAMLYYHVGDKDVLYATVITAVVDRAVAAMRAAIAAAPTHEEKLAAAVRVIAETAESNPLLPSMMLREIAGGGADIPDFALRKIAEVFRTVGAVLEEGAAAGEFRSVDPVITHMLIGGSVFLLTAGTPLRRRIRQLKGGGAKAFRDGSPRELAADFLRLLMLGLHHPGEKA